MSGLTDSKMAEHQCLESEQHSGRLQTAQNDAVVEKVENLVMADCCLTVYERLVKRLESAKIPHMQFFMMI